MTGTRAGPWLWLLYCCVPVGTRGGIGRLGCGPVVVPRRPCSWLALISCWMRVRVLLASETSLLSHGLGLVASARYGRAAPRGCLVQLPRLLHLWSHNFIHIIRREVVIFVCKLIKGNQSQLLVAVIRSFCTAQLGVIKRPQDELLY